MIIQSPKISINTESNIIDNRIIGKARALYNQIARSMSTQSSFVKRTVLNYDINIKVFNSGSGFIYGFIDIYYKPINEEILNEKTFITRFENNNVDEYYKFNILNELNIRSKLYDKDLKANIYWSNYKNVVSWKGPDDNYRMFNSHFQESYTPFVLAKEDETIIMIKNSSFSATIKSSFSNYLYLNEDLIYLYHDNRVIVGAGINKNSIICITCDIPNFNNTVSDISIGLYLNIYNISAKSWSNIDIALDENNVLNYLTNTVNPYHKPPALSNVTASNINDVEKYNKSYSGSIVRFNHSGDEFCYTDWLNFYQVVRRFKIDYENNYTITEITDSTSNLPHSNYCKFQYSAVNFPLSTLNYSYSANYPVTLNLRGDYNKNNIKYLKCKIQSFEDKYSRETFSEGGGDPNTITYTNESYDRSSNIEVLDCNNKLIENIYLNVSGTRNYYTNNYDVETDVQDIQGNGKFINFIYIDVANNIYLYYRTKLTINADSSIYTYRYDTDIVLYTNSDHKILKSYSNTFNYNVPLYSTGTIRFIRGIESLIFRSAAYKYPELDREGASVFSIYEESLDLPLGYFSVNTPKIPELIFNDFTVSYSLVNSVEGMNFNGGFFYSDSEILLIYLDTDLYIGHIDISENYSILLDGKSITNYQYDNINDNLILFSDKFKYTKGFSKQISSITYIKDIYLGESINPELKQDKLLNIKPLVQSSLTITNYFDNYTNGINNIHNHGFHRIK